MGGGGGGGGGLNIAGKSSNLTRVCQPGPIVTS